MSYLNNTMNCRKLKANFAEYFRRDPGKGLKNIEIKTNNLAKHDIMSKCLTKVEMNKFF